MSLSRLGDLQPAHRTQAHTGDLTRWEGIPREQLHEVNLGWHPRAEEVLWQPAAQETKRSENGALNVRYAREIKRDALARLRELIAGHAPWLRIRYAF